jgi:membrane-bound lytic murein transglycosylase F
MNLNKKLLFLSTIPIVIFCFLSCSPKTDNKSPEEGMAIEPVDFDFEKIKERGYINAIVDNSATSYFIYKGKPMGYEYEMLKWFCKDNDLDLRITITNDIADALEMLNRGEGDIAAFNLTITNERKNTIDFTDALYLSRQILVQKKPENWRQMKIHEIENDLIRDPIELIGQEVHVRKSSSFASRLANLSDEIGGHIVIIEDSSKVEVEELIRQVAEGEIQYTVADEDIAMLSATYYPIIDVKTPISFSQQIAWGLRKNSDSLKSVINIWLEKKQKQTDYYVVYNKYFKNLKRSVDRSYSEFSSVSGDKLSPFDEKIKQTAITIGWDWRLLASLIFQESKFDPNASSWAGAVGLMQLMDNTAAEFGAVNLTNPDESLKAGAAYIKWLEKTLGKRVEDSVERQKFILAAYNVGIGHLEDARRLTEKYGGDPDVWDDNVEKYLLLKSKEKYYTDDVVKYGYCRGSEPVNYVEEILKRFDQYKQLLKEVEKPQNLQASVSY